MFAFYCTSNLDYIYFALTKGDGKMKIETNRGCVSKFEELKIGDVFIFNDEVFIKIEATGINAVYLKNGTTSYFFEDTEVKLIVDVTLVLN